MNTIERWYISFIGQTRLVSPAVTKLVLRAISILCQRGNKWVALFFYVYTKRRNNYAIIAKIDCRGLRKPRNKPARQTSCFVVIPSWKHMSTKYIVSGKLKLQNITTGDLLSIIIVFVRCYNFLTILWQSKVSRWLSNTYNERIIVLCNTNTFHAINSCRKWSISLFSERNNVRLSITTFDYDLCRTVIACRFRCFRRVRRNATRKTRNKRWQNKFCRWNALERF